MGTNKVITFILMFLLCTGCDSEPENKIRTATSRPVTVLQLEENEFSREVYLTGSVNLYREEKVGFEISGRILAVKDVGKEVEGATYDENGNLVHPGEIIATLDDTRYRLKVDALHERLNATQKELEATKAALKLAGQTLDRQKKFLRKAQE